MSAARGRGANCAVVPDNDEEVTTTVWKRNFSLFSSMHALRRRPASLAGVQTDSPDDSFLVLNFYSMACLDVIVDECSFHVSFGKLT
ncbi:hypothetical protein ACOMHN_026386 [Nucella lapillus]